MLGPRCWPFSVIETSCNPSKWFDGYRPDPDIARAFVEVQTIGKTCKHFLPGVGMRMGFVIHPPHESQTDSYRPASELAPMVSLGASSEHAAEEISITIP